ncbi:hypothetical protein TTHERM_00374890 (macronuclear) [Tetrahymena thermophila SB210]|uniref:Uncharacterized protein n=1 Tax=Tetrahymena thermophila (strain SB210) TaxID=312017 RepID=I7MDL8_TETTS|nr:hypothetical protein TTHERM_00374890 [Tetrahymena thermophila SB210]EAR89373.2 hypothetical protein TTHERM_00374890 [Tetrahymena thermophila SB210]|eukprot:XP_001009618.2 hypothetical protein TTHERM_00374890 [Tetrahymena thermophila SB210]
MKKVSYETNNKDQNFDLSDHYYRLSAKKSVIDNISCISFLSESFLVCGDDQGQLQIFQTKSLNKVASQKVFDHTLDKIHGPFGDGFFFLQSQFSNLIKLVHLNFQTFAHLKNIQENQIHINVISAYKFDGAIQLFQKISDSQFVISFKCGQLKFFDFNTDSNNSQESINYGAFQNNLSQSNLKASRIKEELYNSDEYILIYQNYQNYQKENKFFQETSQFRFNSAITHVSRINTELIVCCSAKELAIVNNNQILHTCKHNFEHLGFIIPFNKDSFIIGSQRGYLQLVFYNKCKQSLQQIMNYNLPNANIVTSLNKYGSRSIIYSSEKGAYIHDLMSHQTICLHSNFSTATAFQFNLDSYDKNIVIADKLSSLHLFSSSKDSKISA